jgi:putative component of membrane protein insertase Oxa1/YidC/SpoIIIJ protein YidD
VTNPTSPVPAIDTDGLPAAGGLVSRLAAGLISLYQRHVSPRKGFRCAHRVLHRGESCSQYIRRIVLERGIAAAAGAARERFRDCREARNVLRAAQSDGADDSTDDEGSRNDQRIPRACGLAILPFESCCAAGAAFGGKKADAGADAADAGADAAGAGADAVGAAADASGSAGEGVCGGCDAMPADCCS